MKKRFIFGLISLLLAATMLLAACSSTTTNQTTSSTAPTTQSSVAQTSAPSGATIELKLASTSPANIPLTQKYVELENRITQASGGRVKFTNYFAGSLLQAQEMWSGIVSGVADIGEAWPTQPQYKLTSVMNLPFLGIKDQVEATAIFKELLQTPALQNEYKDVQTLYPMAWGYTNYIATTKKQIKTLADLKGVKIIAAQLDPNFITALGAVPVNVGFADWYTSLQSGLVDGYIGYLQSTKAAGASDLFKYLLTLPEPVNFSAGPLLFNKDKWNSLPKDIQQIFLDQEQWYDDYQFNVVTAQQETTIANGLKANGSVFSTMSDSDFQQMKQDVAPVQQAWVQRWVGQGVPADVVLKDVENFVAQYNK